MLSTVNYSLSQTWQTGEQASPARHVFLSPHLWSTLPSPEVFPLTGGTGNSLPSMLDSHWHLSGPTHSESSLSTGHQNNTTHTEDTSSTILVFDCLEYLWLQFPYLQNGVRLCEPPISQTLLGQVESGYPPQMNYIQKTKIYEFVNGSLRWVC